MTTSDQQLKILMEIQGEVSGNTKVSEGILASISAMKADIVDLNKKVGYTNGKVKLHSKILLVVGTVLATLMVTNGNKDLIEIVKIFI